MRIVAAAEISDSQKYSLRDLPSQVIHEFTAEGSYGSRIENDMAIAAKSDNAGRRIDLKHIPKIYTLCAHERTQP
jgi:hypothetical protein